MIDNHYILIVDDEPSITRLLAIKISSRFSAYQIITAHNGDEALEKILTTRPDLIIADIDMPVMNGMELLQHVKNDEYQDIPFIIITGKGAKETAIMAIKAGAYDYIEKPFEDDELLQSVHRAIEKRQLELAQQTYRKELELTNELLRKTTISKTFFESVISLIPAAIIVIDRDYHVQFCQGSHLSELGILSKISFEDKGTRKIEEILDEQIIHHETFHKKIEATFSHSQSHAELLELQRDLYHTYFLNLQMIMVSESQLLIIISNVTAQIHYQKELAKNDRLQTIATLSSGLAHEIRNPLGIVLGHAQTLKRFLVNADSDTLHSLDVISAQVQRANQVIQQLFEFAKDNQETYEPNEIVHILEIIEETLSLLSFAIQKHKIKIEIKQKSEIYVVAVKTQIQQVFINIIKNAIEAFDESKSNTNNTITISFENNSKQKQNIITITDNGIGIRSDKIQHVFDPFFTTKQSGGGMGLAVCQMIIQKYHGEITLYNNISAGVSVCITLPEYQRTK